MDLDKVRDTFKKKKVEAKADMRLQEVVANIHFLA